jgi:hypothetical protein
MTFLFEGVLASMLIGNPSRSLILLSIVLILLFGIETIITFRKGSPRWFKWGMITILIGCAMLGMWAGYYAITGPSDPDLIYPGTPVDGSNPYYYGPYLFMIRLQSWVVVAAFVLFIASLVAFSNIGHRVDFVHFIKYGTLWADLPEDEEMEDAVALEDPD